VFTSLLTNLQSLISSNFVVASFFPTLAFWFANAVMLYRFNAPFRDYVQNSLNQTAGMTTVVTAAALIGVAFTAYAEAALLPTIQSLLEGNWPRWLIWFFTPAQARRYNRLEVAIHRNAKLRGPLEKPVGNEIQTRAWQSRLTAAREAGQNARRQARRTARDAGQPEPALNTYRRSEESAKTVAALDRLRSHASAISAAQLGRAVEQLVVDLGHHDANDAGPDHDYALENTRQLLWDLIDYAEDYPKDQYRLLKGKQQLWFGNPPLAPTRMGNVAKTAQRYAVKRYEFNFEAFWSRLQFLAQKDTDFGLSLKSAKTQFDFLLSCSAFTFLWTVLWAGWLYCSFGPGLTFLGIALLGPVLAYVWYRVAVVQYSTLADLMRSATDLFRLDLLARLQYQRPASVDQERELWHTIDAMHELYEIRELPYAEPSKGP
jgi:hypothetical protein